MTSYCADKPNFLEFWVKMAKMTLKVKVNDLHFQYQPRVSHDACLVQIWWFLFKFVTSYSADKVKFTDRRTDGWTDGQTGRRRKRQYPFRPERPRGKNGTGLNIDYVIVKGRNAPYVFISQWMSDQSTLDMAQRSHVCFGVTYFSWECGCQYWTLSPNHQNMTLKKIMNICRVICKCYIN